MAHTAVTLMLYTACARSDVVKLGWQNLKGDRLQYRRQKTEGVSTVLIDIPVHPELRKVLDTLPNDKLTFLETRGGRSRTANGLGTAMRKWCDDAPPGWQRQGQLSAKSWLGRATTHQQWCRYMQAKRVAVSWPITVLKS